MKTPTYLEAYALAVGITAVYLPYLVACFVIEGLYRGGE